MSDPQKPQINKDFKLAQLEAEKQKIRDNEAKALLSERQHAQEEKRLERLAQIKDEKTRADIREKIERDDNNTANQLQKQKETQAEKINRETAKKTKEQSDKVFTIQGVTGSSPAAIYDRTAARFKAMHDREQRVFVRNSHDSSRADIDHEIKQAVDRQVKQERERQEQIQSRPADQVFEKSAEDKSIKDAFGVAHDRKSEKDEWRKLMEGSPKKADYER